MSADWFIALPSLVLAAAEAGHGEGPAIWSTVVDIITVVFCFILVYWVLKAYAFGPILAAIDERRHSIDSDLKRAEEARVQAEKDRADIEQRLRGIEDESRRKMQEMLNEGKQAADEIREKGRLDAEELLEKARQNIQYETQKAREELKGEIIDLTLKATELIIKERLDDDKHRGLIGDFISRIERN